MVDKYVIKMLAITFALFLALSVLSYKVSKSEDIYKTADSLLGRRYSEYDCSKFTQTCFSDAGIYLPRVSTSQFRYAKQMENNIPELKKLIFFDTGWTMRKPNHVGIMRGQILYHSVRKGVVKQKINNYWKDRMYKGN